MKVVVVVPDDVLYIPDFLDPFLSQARARGIDVRMVAILRPFNETRVALARRMLLFYGPLDFLRQTGRYVASRMNRSRGAALLAAAASVPSVVVRDINAEEFVRQIGELHTDVVLSVSAPQIFKGPLLRAPRWGCLNIHAALLPKYRGMMPNFWAMYHGDTEAGITIHTMDASIDRGKVILQGVVPIRDVDTLDDLMKKSKRRAADLALDALRGIAEGTLRPRDYDGETSYHSFPSRADVKLFRRRGRRLL